MTDDIFGFKNPGEKLRKFRLQRQAGVPVRERFNDTGKAAFDFVSGVGRGVNQDLQHGIGSQLMVSGKDLGVNIGRAFANRAESLNRESSDPVVRDLQKKADQQGIPFESASPDSANLGLNTTPVFSDTQSPAVRETVEGPFKNRTFTGTRSGITLQDVQRPGSPGTLSVSGIDPRQRRDTAELVRYLNEQSEIIREGNLARAAQNGDRNAQKTLEALGGQPTQQDRNFAREQTLAQLQGEQIKAGGRVAQEQIKASAKEKESQRKIEDGMFADKNLQEVTGLTENQLRDSTNKNIPRVQQRLRDIERSNPQMGKLPDKPDTAFMLTVLQNMRRLQSGNTGNWWALWMNTSTDNELFNRAVDMAVQNLI